ncbi:G-type lectin S-receptor-like serine/threonine-protein kinase SD2-5 [Malania oleifera]|uniref:G-type lectin S-receptor-like serine/threonine-protein kinase SD2-5 n=1 Tax=Malania oleifera TaxID=397392 RepID=UPI0025AE3D91|nr:G-type lectin S-receptor-like serine/threonine-protein kinase SD2-5 [Malania oleifera]
MNIQPLYGFLLIIWLSIAGRSIVKSENHIEVGYRVMMEVPEEYRYGFVGRAYLMEAKQAAEPKFRAALSVEGVEGNRYACSLEVFLGDVRVWSSGHLSRFYTAEKCVVELTEKGDLRLKGPQERLGWRTATSGQGVQRLRLLKNGNLVLVDSLNRIKWQSFNYPTDVLLWGQSVEVATRLTSFPTNSTSFYSLEIQNDKVALYLNSGNMQYSYWDFKPSSTRNITFVEVGTRGLEFFDDKNRKFALIPSQRLEPVRFLALGNRTGNLELFFYSTEKEKFEASFQALKTTCDLPMACKPYGICTFSDACLCLQIAARQGRMVSNCSEGIPSGFCERGEAEMLELEGVSSVLRGVSSSVNISKEACTALCIDNCNCTAALYSSGEGTNRELQECFLYGFVGGVKQVRTGIGLSYLVKVPKGTGGDHGKSSGLKKWVLIMVAVADVFIIFMALGGLGLYLIRKRRKDLPDRS